MIRPITDAKNYVKTHSRTIAWSMAGVAALGCAFLLGKDQGATVVDVHFLVKDQDGNIAQMTSPGK